MYTASDSAQRNGGDWPSSRNPLHANARAYSLIFQALRDRRKDSLDGAGLGLQQSWRSQRLLWDEIMVTGVATSPALHFVEGMENIVPDNYAKHFLYQ